MMAEFASAIYREIQAGGTAAQWGLGWQREGGIAGFCNNLLVYRSGVALATSCKGTGSARLGSAYLNPDSAFCGCLIRLQKKVKAGRRRKILSAKAQLIYM